MAPRSEFLKKVSNVNMGICEVLRKKIRPAKTLKCHSTDKFHNKILNFTGYTRLVVFLNIMWKKTTPMEGNTFENAQQGRFSLAPRNI